MNPLVLLLSAAALASPQDGAPEPESPAPDPAPTEEAAEEDAETVTMPSAGPEDVGSALDDPTPVSMPGEDGGLADVFQHLRQQDRTSWSSGNFVKPTLGLVLTEHVRPVTLGVSAGRRWWQLKDGFSASVTVRGDADFALAGGAGSHDLSLAVLTGPWLEVVGLQVGPGIGHSRMSLGPETLVAATGLDAHALLTADLRLLQLYAGVAPRWLVATDRAAADHNPLGLGDELLLRAGAGIAPGGLRIGVGWDRRFTAIGPIDRFGVNLRLSIL